MIRSSVFQFDFVSADALGWYFLVLDSRSFERQSLDIFLLFKCVAVCPHLLKQILYVTDYVSSWVAVTVIENSICVRWLRTYLSLQFSCVSSGD